jgi:hypothetical protein
MAKYRLKTLYKSIYGGNITLMMNKITIIIWMKLINHHQCDKQKDEFIQYINEESTKCIFVF